MDDFEGLSDHFILRMYEFIRNEVQADALAGTRLVGVPAKQRADRLLREIGRRGLVCRPIDWPAYLAAPDDLLDARAQLRKITSV
ncbi:MULTISPECIES: hypothetical protein [Bradyrhizobium]|uniref:hypothetical protein n=1 Tax=Bradyrhizobium TaxID=374 RepID=UPI000428B893|nr:MULTISPECIES: hypothetical protein [Bradyrhizobium]QOG18062.1 hypothetical protein FOM02_12575 [Bradyrhizobium sp. SEMIA]UFW52090.1 hypothetical protein BaraCB756_14365 [Bradyrhizobium arachidis]